MSQDKYFDKFPLITYSNNIVVDITKRVTLLDRVSKNPYIFYPFDLSGSERADQFSNRYYDDSYKSWILYLSNNITDPYYEWYLSNDELNNLIEKKYGSIVDAQQKIKYYRNDWENQDPISVSAYDSLSENRKKYWNPEYLNGNKIINYVRKEIDWSINTNKIISYGVSNNNYVKNEICNIRLQGNEIGKGQVVFSTNNYLYIQHVSGTFYTNEDVSLNQNSYIYGVESKANSVVTSISALANNLPEDEIVYWKPITYYEYEVEKNEFNKSIRVMDKNNAFTAVDNLRVLLENN
jgi:hypothetical protein